MGIHAHTYIQLEIPVDRFLKSSLTSRGASLVAQRVKHLLALQGDLGSIPGSGRSPGEGNGNPLQYYCLENPMEGEA